jgi:hypothetical protein
MFLAPELSAQFMTAPTGRARDMRYLDPVAAAMKERREKAVEVRTYQDEIRVVRSAKQEQKA